MKILQIRTTKSLDQDTRSTLDRIMEQHKKASSIPVAHSWEGNTLQLRVSKPPLSGEFAFIDQEITVHLDCPGWVLRMINGTIQKKAVSILGDVLQEAGLIKSIKDISVAKG